MVSFYMPTKKEIDEATKEKRLYSGIDAVNIDDLKKFIGKAYILEKENCSLYGRDFPSEINNDSDFSFMNYLTFGRGETDIIKVIGIKVINDIVYFRIREAHLTFNGWYPKLYVHSDMNIAVHYFLNECNNHYREITSDDIDGAKSIDEPHGILQDVIWSKMQLFIDELHASYTDMIAMINDDLEHE